MLSYYVIRNANENLIEHLGWHASWCIEIRDKGYIILIKTRCCMPYFCSRICLLQALVCRHRMEINNQLTSQVSKFILNTHHVSISKLHKALLTGKELRYSSQNKHTRN